ncbi:hypothetical protein LCGC14_2168270 [marine sediment metagenome]|uniref:Uncharacterized protein n=1 Tax=marine sediment metagenome TaxID=412755 RepID=A0A0F9ECZ4_9ZZZZ
MSNEQEPREGSDDKSIVDALSTLGWVEEEEEEEEILPPGDNLQEQLAFFKEENKRLIGEINEKNEKIQYFEVNVQELTKKAESKSIQDQAVQKLFETIESKNDEIENLNILLDEQSKKSNRIIDDQIDKIKTLTSEIDNINLNETDNQDLNKKIQEKDTKINELMEQLQYLENDSIQRSKFEKLEVLLEKKDEIITEKEKAIFNVETILKTANQKIQDLQQQFETFNLMKKDLEKKIERNKALVVEIEELNQKNISNQELINHHEEKLEEAHKKFGNLAGKFELELGSMRNMLDDRDNDLKNLTESTQKLQDELQESEQIEEKLLNEIQKMKDEKIKWESDLEENNKKIIELKKTIKLMRRDMQKA